jgi:hypothetical protein
MHNVTVGGRIGLAILTQLLLLGACGFAIVDKDQQLQLLIAGAIIANATTAINWFFGSSAGSEKKDDIIAGKANGDGVPGAKPAST